MDEAFRLRPNMLLGVGSSATQADGGSLGHTWNDWAAKGLIRDGSDPAVAAGHWDRWREDILLMHKLGIQTCRFSIEWARVEPREGVFDEKAIAHIKEEIMLMSALGIKPLVTLHHFTNPLWFEQKGGWLKAENVRCYLLYVEKIIKNTGHLCREFITINEPNIYAVNGYIKGIWPPGVKSPTAAFEVMSNMATAHIKAYRLIHDMRRSMGFHDTGVSFAGHMRVYAPKNAANPLHTHNAALAERIFQSALTRAMLTGEFKRPLRNNGRDRRGAYCDFHAVNYSFRSAVSTLSESMVAGSEKNDLGWEIYPHGLVECCEKLTKLMRLPIYITANGVCDLSDSFRSRFIYEHLREICNTQLPVKRYYYWSFMDGFEWLDGRYAKFGLVDVDPASMERSVKRSGEFYSKIIKSGGVTQELYDEYVSGQEYHH